MGLKQMKKMATRDVNLVNGEYTTGNGGSSARRVSLLTLWTAMFVWVGLMKGLGVMLPTLQEQFETKAWIIGWIMAMILCASGLSSPFAGMVNRRFGAGTVVMTCGVLIATAAIVGSLAVSAYQLALPYMLLAGTSLGLTMVLTKQELGRCFDKNHATAVGIARTGSSVGFICLAPLVQVLLNTYGWRGTMLLMGAIFAHLAVCGALMRTSGGGKQLLSDHQRIPLDEPPATQESKMSSACLEFWRSFVENFDLKLLWNVRFWTVAVISCQTQFVSNMWTIYFVSMALTKGLSLEQAATLITIGGVGALVAEIVQGFLVDKSIISSWSLMVVGVIFSWFAYCATPWLTSYWTLMTSTLFILISDSLILCLVDVILKQILGVELLAGAYGWMAIQMLIMWLTVSYLPGLIYDRTGTYDMAFFFLGCTHALSLASLLIIKYLKYVE